MPYDYNKYRRKRVQSEQELSLAQMMQTVLNEVGTPSGAFFAYEKQVFSKADGVVYPELTVRSGTFQATPSGLAISSSTGSIKCGTSTIGTYTVTLDIGAPPNPGEPGGRYEQEITIVA